MTPHYRVSRESGTRTGWSLRTAKGGEKKHMKDLANATPGELVQVEEVVFGSVREYCRESGIRPGTRLLCHGTDSTGMVEVEDMDGHVVQMTRDLALFVWVSSDPSDLSS